MLSQIKQIQIDKYVESGKPEFIEIESRRVVIRSWEKGEMKR